MSQRRSGFTLVEVLVSMALTIFILTILAQAFVMGTDMFRTLKAVGDLNDSLRTAATIIRSDLSADHFGDKRRLSDNKFYTLPNDGPPKQGYFFMYLPATGVNEGTDPDGMVTRRRTGHILAGTAKARGNRPQDFYTMLDPLQKLAPLGSPDARFQQSGTFSSQWIEFCYFMVPVPGASAGGTPLYALYRQQRLVVSDVDTINWTQKLDKLTYYAAYKNKVSCQPNPNGAAIGYLYFNSPADLTIPERRTAGAFQPLDITSFKPFVDPVTGLPSGEDLLLTDVLSFDVQVLLSSSLAQFGDLPAGRFDTWSQRVDDVYNYSATANPYTLQPATIRALKITLRVWDAKSKITRQITMVQDM